jgi:hypothetical protein
MQLLNIFIEPGSPHVLVFKYKDKESRVMKFDSHNDAKQQLEIAQKLLGVSDGKN